METPRPYQLQLFQKAKNKNIIAYLDTGSGKTLVSILLIEEYAKPLLVLSRETIINLLKEQQSNRINPQSTTISSEKTMSSSSSSPPSLSSPISSSSSSKVVPFNTSNTALGHLPDESAVVRMNDMTTLGPLSPSTQKTNYDFARNIRNNHSNSIYTLG